MLKFSFGSTGIDNKVLKWMDLLSASVSPVGAARSVWTGPEARDSNRAGRDLPSTDGTNST